MTRFTRLCRAVGVSLAVAAATLSMTQAAHAELPTPTVPDPVIAAPAGNEVFLVGHATGKQIYTCNGNGSWGTAVPQADLYDNGKLIIKHFAGPTWQEVPDGSSVVGAKVNNGVSPDPNAIPWLLLKATKTTAGRGGHLLSDTGPSARRSSGTSGPVAIGALAVVLIGLAVAGYVLAPNLYPPTLGPDAPAALQAAVESARLAAISSARASIAVALAGIGALITILIHYRNRADVLAAISELAQLPPREGVARLLPRRPVP